ncbi:hypothetical protein [Echinimonas agarilytica]|uniref:Lipocalin-like domain-containing protein n=1 Tax=Echinimonas agarilytica TaxID=1215918 RepID=A0AA41W4C0_9GAMM|nr:hypothetical protein [Echinimonas agarilytica]MCM2678453.1 hypothetical protein [Echinimonas agarilytica]
MKAFSNILSTLCILLCISPLTQAEVLDGVWRIRAFEDEKTIQTRFDFKPKIMHTGALVLHRYPPMCKRSELYFELGPAVFDDSLNRDDITMTFKVDYYPARKAKFTGFIQARETGDFLVLRMDSLERSSTFLAAISAGSNLTIQMSDSALHRTWEFPLKGTQKAVEDGYQGCIRMSHELDGNGTL